MKIGWRGKDKDGNTIFHTAALSRYGKEETLKKLFLKNPPGLAFILSIKNKEGLTPLQTYVKSSCGLYSEKYADVKGSPLNIYKKNYKHFRNLYYTCLDDKMIYMFLSKGGV